MAVAVGTGIVRGFAPVTLKASAAETSSTAGSAVAMSMERGAVLVTVDVTASSGTPTMIVDIQGSIDGTTWVTLGTFGNNGYVAGTPATAPTNLTGTTVTKRGVLSSMPYLRYNSTIGGGTPSVTYSVTAEEV